MSSFHERQKSLFNHLKVAEEQHGFSQCNKAEAPQDYSTVDRHTYKKVKRDMKQFRGRESIYKRKDANIRQCLRSKSIPDHMKNPQKWVYYSLSDVTPDQLSESTNTATALAFMREMEEREADIKTEHMDETGVFKKPTFQISKTVKIEPKGEDEKAVFKGNKIIMPEYVVGVSKKREKKTRIAFRSEHDSPELKKNADLKLNHLYEDDEEE